MSKAPRGSRIRDENLHLITFLLCSTRPGCAVNKLTGNPHILRQIWTLVCEEWWDLNIIRYNCDDPMLIPNLSQPWTDGGNSSSTCNDDEENEHQRAERNYPKKRQHCGGCPVATLAFNVPFPGLTVVAPNRFGPHSQPTEALYVNMMPFSLYDKSSLPEECHQYWSIIELCTARLAPNRAGGRVREKSPTAYLTINERPTSDGVSPCRSDLHVDSPGVLPIASAATSEPQYLLATEGGRYVPGVEHHWGRGIMMRDEWVQGGIFMASSIPDATAVWNCHINNDAGDIIGAHGDIERLRPLLGPCARSLGAGELVWMTDRTPHESLPVPAGTRRQYFRLVVGTVTAWYADHSTPNPLGYLPDETVFTVTGDKYKRPVVLGNVAYRPSWHCGTVHQLQAARAFAPVQALMYEFGLGHLRQRFLDYGCTSLQRIAALDAAQEKQGVREFNRWGQEHSADGRSMFRGRGSGYYEIIQMMKLAKRVRQLCDIPV